MQTQMLSTRLPSFLCLKPPHHAIDFMNGLTKCGALESCSVKRVHHAIQVSSVVEVPAPDGGGFGQRVRRDQDSLVV